MEKNIDWLKISVVTPSFNQGRFLEKTICSVLNQEYPGLEYIVMDGGSMDGSTEIIRKYEDRLAYWQSVPDDGQYGAIQKGFDRSSGEVMAYLNSDDLYFPWTLRVVAEIFAKFPAVEWLTTSCTSAVTSEGLFPVFFNRYNRSRRRFFETRGKLLGRRDFIQQEATFWRRSLWEKSGAKLEVNLRYAGDFDLWSRFYQYATPVTVHVPLAMFRIHAQQKTMSLDQYMAEAESVLTKYPRPVWMPSLILRLAAFAYKHLRSDANWFGMRSDAVHYSVRDTDWVYEKKLEWIG